MTNKPSRPMSAYMIWLNSNRESIKAQNPGLKLSEIAKKGGEIWRAMKDKSEWEEKADILKKQYTKELEIYETKRREGMAASQKPGPGLQDEENCQSSDSSDDYHPYKNQPSRSVGAKEPPNITCSYKSTTGRLYPQENGFMYVPETPPVNISFQDIINVKVARGQVSSNEQSFDLEILLKSGDVHAFNGISQGEYEKLINYIASKNVHVKNVLFMFDDAQLEYQNAGANENQPVTENAKPATESG